MTCHRAFPGGVGNTSGDADAFSSLLHDVTATVFDRLPDETRFYPAGTTIRAPVKTMAELRNRSMRPSAIAYSARPT